VSRALAPFEFARARHARLNRQARQPLEAVPAFVRVGVLGLHTAHNEDGLDANAKFIGFVYYLKISYQRDEHDYSQIRW
jgi:hypothetical protein